MGVFEFRVGVFINFFFIFRARLTLRCVFRLAEQEKYRCVAENTRGIRSCAPSYLTVCTLELINVDSNALKETIFALCLPTSSS